jgi:HEPN domain-containing protein
MFILMDINEHIRHWLNLADEDLKAAKTMLTNKHYLWSLFLCHLVIEKTLRAKYIEETKEILPPKSHNLLKLAEYCNLELDQEKRLLLFKINDFNIEARFPDYKSNLNKIADDKFTNYYYSEVLGILKWIRQEMKYYQN